MSKTLHLADGPEAEPRDTCLHLKKEILDPLEKLVSVETPAAWALVHDRHVDTVFDPERARALAEECEGLAGAAAPPLAVWLPTLAALAKAAARQGRFVIALEEGHAYFRPRVMRHLTGDGREEYAIHEVYFYADGRSDMWTVDALSPREPTVEALRETLTRLLGQDTEKVTCGDLGYEYDRVDIEEWLEFLYQDPMDYQEGEE